MKLYTDEEFEAYTEAAHKAGVVFSVGSDGVVRAEYNPAVAKCVASWDADGEIEQPMPDKANEHAPTTSQDSQAETTAGKSSPTAQPAVEEEWETRGIAACMRLNAKLRAELTEALERIERLEAALRRVQWCIYVEEAHGGSSLLCPMCDQVEARGHAPDCLIGAALEVPAPDSTPPRRDELAGDVQPLRPREQ